MCFAVCFWVSLRKRLAACFLPPGDANFLTQIVGFRMNYLLVMCTRQATRANFGSILMFSKFWINIDW